MSTDTQQQEVDCPACQGVGEIHDEWVPAVRPDGWMTEPEVCMWCQGKGCVSAVWARQYRGRRRSNA